MQKIKIQNANSELILNLERGGQIEKLSLKNPNTSEQISVILPYDPLNSFFLSGNFLMFPWVNRLEDNKIQVSGRSISIEPKEKDPKGRPIHGLYFDSQRKLADSKLNFAKIESIRVNEHFPQFTESYTLEESALRIRTDFFNDTEFIQEFAYGYHPYLRLNGNINDCVIDTNLTEYIPLTSELLPNQNLEKKEIRELFSTAKPIGELKLDHLLTGVERELYFGISFPLENLKLQVNISASSQISLPFFQIYIPENRESIAIEPMSSTGNAFFIKNSKLCKLNPGESKYGEFSIELKKMKKVLLEGETETI